jgi:integrase/recombinase XerD
MRRTALKTLDWPEVDRAMWEQLIKKGSLLDDQGSGAHWATETRRVNARDYSYWLSFLLATNPAALNESPTARVTPDRVRCYCRSMEDVSALTRASRIARLHTLIRGADPKGAFGWLAAIRRGQERLARREGPVRSKHGRLFATGKIIEAGVSLLKQAHGAQDRSFHARAKDFRDGLMIALLAARPLRIKNFATLRLGQHLEATSSGYLIDIPGAETKTGHPIETFVPEDLCRWLSIYLEEYRPGLLCGRHSDHLWVHKTGHSYRPGSLSQRISKLTARILGVAISPHLFRDCAATTIATDDPEHVLIIAPLLGHTTLKTAELHYNHAQGLEANRRLQDCIKRIRRKAIPRP